MRAPSLIRDLADFCYPRTCSVCAAEADAWPLCDDCEYKLEKIEAHPYCQRCAMPLASAGAPCPHCLGKGVRPYERIARLCSFEEPVRQLVHSLKFHRAWAIGEFVAERLHAQSAVRTMLDQCDLLVPVPLHPLRQMTRGYNQAQVIAKRLAKLSGKRVANPAARIQHTDAQTVVQSKTQRLQNLWNAFGLLDPKKLVMKRVVVIDDVRTTAATLQAFGRCLGEAAPASLNAIVVAAADPRHAEFKKI